MERSEYFPTMFDVSNIGMALSSVQMLFHSDNFKL